MLIFYPGYSTVDARYVYADAMAWHFGDWQSPAMVVLWRLIDPIAPGASSMFLLTATLYWLAFGTLAFVAARRSVWLGLATVLLASRPPAFFFVGMIWRDVLFAVIWLTAAVLAFAAADHPRACARPFSSLGASQALALPLIALGVLLRPNAMVAAPVLAAYVIRPMRFDLKRTAVLFLPALVASTHSYHSSIYKRILDAERQIRLHSIAVFDLGGITHFSGDNQFPVAWSGDQTALLDSASATTRSAGTPIGTSSPARL